MLQLVGNMLGRTAERAAGSSVEEAKNPTRPVLCLLQTCFIFVCMYIHTQIYKNTYISGY